MSLLNGHLLNSKLLNGSGKATKTILRGTATIANPDTSTNVTLTPALGNYKKASVKISLKMPNAQPDDCWVEAKITSNTNLNLSRVANGGTVTIEWEVTEWDYVKSVQSNEVTLNATSTTDTITTVKTSNAKIIHSFKTDFDAATGEMQWSISAELTNATTVTFERTIAGAAYTGTIQYYVIEFY